jgi:hypothetical protein
MHVKVVDRVTQEKAEESQRKERDRKGPVIGEGPLPALRTSDEPTRPERAETRSSRSELARSGQEAAREKEKPKKIVFGMAAEEPAPKAEPKEEAGESKEEADDEADEEKAAEEDANYFAGGDDPEDIVDK